MTKPKTAARAGLKLLKWFLILLVVLVAALFSVNAFDEDLHPDAAAALAWPESNVNPANNGYFTLVGLSAPAGQDATAWGQGWVATLNRVHSRGEAEAAGKSLAAAPLKFAGLSSALCEFRGGRPCAPEAAKRAADIGRLAADNAELLVRYAALLAFPQVVETYRPHSVSHPLPDLFVYTPAQRLVLSQALADFERDGGRPTLRQISDDIGLQRRILGGAASLVLKMVATGALARDYQALAEVIRRHPALAAAEAATLQRALAPLSPSELALRPAMMAEFRTTAAILDDPAITDPASFQMMQVLGLATPVNDPRAPVVLKAAVLDAVLAPLMKGAAAALLQKNATRNRQYAALNAVAALDDVPGPGLGAAEQALRARLDDGIDWSWVYNPYGRLILAVATPDFSKFKRRQLDVEGLRRLVALQVRIAAGAIADADIPAFLASSEAALADPYTNQAMRWDGEQRALLFETANNASWFMVGKDGRIAVAL
jgi:hypothetical protein